MNYNKIPVAFGVLRKVSTPPINYQYDQKQILVIKGLELPEFYTVDFCNEGDSVTKSMVGTAEGVEIPDEYLLTGKKVKAYIVITDGESVQTRYEVTIPVKVRPARSDIEPTPEEQSVIDGLVAAMNTAVTESGENADRAETAVSHYPKIEAGNWYVWNPENGAYEDTGIQAEGKDGVGIQSATLNANFTLTLTFTDGTSYTTPSIRGEQGKTGQDGVSPTITVTAITGGHRVEITDAEGTKTFSVMDGQTGATPNLQIGTVTTLPAGSEATAEITGTQEQPVLNLGIPEGEKGDTGEVTTAQLTEALQTKADVIISNASGAIASFADGANNQPIRSLIANIEPVQDLHGYDYPWPAGGGVNKLDPSAVFDDASYYTINSDGTVTVTAADGRGWATITSELSLPAGTYTIAKTPTTGTSDIRLSTEDFATSHLFTSQVQFTLSEAGTVKIKIAYSGVTYPQTYKVQIVSGSTVPPWTPYSNICPISGHTGAEIEQRGKNLLNSVDPTIINGYLSMRSGGFAGDTVTIRASANDRIVVIPIKNNTYYTLTYIRKGAVTGTTDDWNVSLFYDEPNVLSVGISTGFNITSNGSRTFYSGQYNFAAIKIANITKTDFSESVKASQLEIGQSSTAHETYVGSTISVDWSDEAGTVYGSALDVLRGLLTIDSELFTLDGTANIYKATQNFFSTDKFNSVADTSKEVIACNKLPVLTPSEIYSGNYGINFNYTGNGFLLFNSSVFDGMSADQVKAWLASNPIQFVAKKINVQSYQLTSKQLDTLLGTNNIWTDVGTVDVEYPADTKLYIEQLTKPTEDDMTADHAIAAGTFFQLGNTLYLATSQIAAGGTITPGTNATQLSLADALNTLNS